MDAYRNTGTHTHTHKASPTALLSSAKVVAEAAQSALRHDTHGYDKAEAADAAANLLCAGSHYAKLDDGRYGTYVEKAENYLHQYGHKTHTTSAPASDAHGSGGGSGYGDYVKMAQGLMGHNSSTGAAGHASGEEGGYGDYVKMAQGFLKKY